MDGRRIMDGRKILAVHKCDEYDGTTEVLKSVTQWYAWGSNAFHLAWRKVKHSLFLCEKCELDNWVYCSTCGALIEVYHYGAGYLPDDYEDDGLCPECAEKAGFERTVGIGDPS